HPAELMVTEVMYNPRPADSNDTALGYSQGDFEFIELQNSDSIVGSLVGVRIESGITFNFKGSPVQSLPPGGHLVIVRNLNAFTHRYTNANPANIAGVFSGSLNDSGERIDVVPYDVAAGPWSFTYSDNRDWPQSCDGAGHSLVPLPQAKARGGSLDYGRLWRASAFIDGSPGVPDPTPVHNLLINEILAHTDYSHPSHPEYDSNDALELFNASSTTVTFTDWFLSDDASDLKKWPLPTTQSLASVSHVWFDEVSGFHNPITNGFGLNKDGEQVFLSYLPGTHNDRVVDAFSFAGQENGISVGRYPDGSAYWTDMSPTPGTTNTLPGAHVHISEIMYHPAPTALNPEDNTNGEYIEIYNPLNSTVDLWESIGAWRISGGVNFTFPANISLAAGERIVLLPFDPVADSANRVIFETEYGLTNAQARFLGPYEGKLNNNSERLTLEKPQDPDFPSITISWIIVDEVVYLDEAPWPAGTDATGAGLQRVSNQGAGADPAVWINGFVATPGAKGTILAVATPEHGSRYLIPATVPIGVAIDPAQISPPVERVSFFDGATLLCNVTQAPYTCLVEMNTERDYILTAVLSDSAGSTTSRQSVASAFSLNARPAQNVSEVSATCIANIPAGHSLDILKFYWGEEDATTNMAAWDHVVSQTTPPGPSFSLALNDLVPGMTYYYRVYGEIDGHPGWSSNSVSFVTDALRQWPYQMAIHFPGGPHDPLINFPVLLRLHEGLTNFSFAQFASAQAHDLRISEASSGALLAYEIEHWDTQNISYVWIRVPSFTSNTILNAHWGFTNAASLPPPYTRDGSTWSEHFEAVWHLTPPLVDATGHQAPATDVNTSDSLGCVGPGRGFAGTNAFLVHGPYPSWFNTAQADLTLSLWVRPSTGLPQAATPFGTTGDGSGDALFFNVNTIPFVKKWSIGTGPLVTVTALYQLDQWQRLALIASNGTVFALFNDQAPTLLGSNITLNVTTPLITGRRESPGANFLGQIDEIRFSNRARPPAWIKAAYDTIANHNVFTRYDAVGPPLTTSDIDGNGIPDDWERHFFNVTGIPPAGHSDDDGMSDLEEFIAGTDPTNSTSLFDLQICPSNAMFAVRFFARRAQGPGYESRERYYDLLSALAPSSNAWSAVPEMTNILGADQWAIYTNKPFEQYYFRARTTLK
ncbi:MAG: lamin tail domain-containing protein, partial [Verrucomicrobia bacterium]|nr:lamin tail domain-containing protein [Verrucomicrobiota bacterium]